MADEWPSDTWTAFTTALEQHLAKIREHSAGIRRQVQFIYNVLLFSIIVGVGLFVLALVSSAS